MKPFQIQSFIYGSQLWTNSEKWKKKKNPSVKQAPLVAQPNTNQQKAPYTVFIYSTLV